MLFNKAEKERLNNFFQSLKLVSGEGSKKGEKIEQIISYLEIVHSQFKNHSKKRKLHFVESCAGNCYLSFLIHYYYSEIEKREIEITCIDWNERLMEKNRLKAEQLGFNKINFVTGDILSIDLNFIPDLIYSLHACDTATDGTLHLGVKSGAKRIISVSCCQHSLKKRFRNSRYKAITKHKIFKDRMLYMVGDSMRAILLETFGYNCDLIQFTSSRNTDKNVMLRASKGGNNRSVEKLLDEYNLLKDEFKIEPALAKFNSVQ